MKKTYVKPEIAIESFMLTQSIASLCGAQQVGTANHYSTTCSFTVTFDGSGDEVFTQRPTCRDVIDPSEDMICYQNGAANIRAFAS